MKNLLLLTWCVAAVSGYQYLKFYNHCEFDIAMMIIDENRHKDNRTLIGRNIHCEACDLGSFSYRFGAMDLVIETKPTFTYYGISAETFDFPIQVRPVWNENRRISGKKLRCDEFKCEDIAWDLNELPQKMHITRGEAMEISFCYDTYMEDLKCPDSNKRSKETRDYED